MRFLKLILFIIILTNALMLDAFCQNKSDRIIRDLKTANERLFFNLKDTLSIGRIFLNQNGTGLIGTAFVAGRTKSVYTCSHVAVKDTLFFMYIGSHYIYRLKIKYNLPNFDVALLARTGGVQPNGLDFGDFSRINPGDVIEYMGWDVEANQYVLWKSIVIGKGTSLSDGGASVDFIEFEGQAIPGYSGGPVFNSAGQVVAMVREAWEKKGIKGGQPKMINRVFSVELLRILDSEIISNSIRNNKEGISILELLSK